MATRLHAFVYVFVFVCAVLLCLPVQAQVLNAGTLRYAQLAFDYRAQPARPIKDASGSHYASHEYGLNAYVPLFSRKNTRSKDHANVFGAFLTPNLRFNYVNIDYLYHSRVLVNAGIGAGVYYHFRQKNTLTALLQTQVNEDEFTIYDPVLRYSGMLLYRRRVSERFSYYTGLSYTYLYGDLGKNGFLFPVLGARFSIGKAAQLNITLPYLISYTQRFNQKLRLNISLKPNGGINRYENRYSFPTGDQVLMLRRRSFVLGAGVYYHLSNNVVINPVLGLTMGQKLFFTSEDHSTGYETNTVEPGLQFNIRLVWRPWQNTLRNKEKRESDKAAGDTDDAIDTDLIGF